MPILIYTDPYMYGQKDKVIPKFDSEKDNITVCAKNIFLQWPKHEFEENDQNATGPKHVLWTKNYLRASGPVFFSADWY